jgi:dTDP-4-dehydrorhamnose reductase
MTIVVIGRLGQLAYELRQILGTETICLGSNDTDITDQKQITSTLSALKPQVVINAAAYTAVDKAEQAQEASYAINVTAVENIANYCRDAGAFMVHVSTDYVFNGQKGIPYTVDDRIEPQGVYGNTKAQGEAALLKILPKHSCIIRTAWVYSTHGNNFVKTMLKLMNEKTELSVIDDQIGSPTWAKGLAQACVHAGNEKRSGIFHWTDEGVASWYDFALAIQQLGIKKELIRNAIDIHPIPSSQYPTPAKRPHYSVLDKTLTRATFSSLHMYHWRTQLSDMLTALKQQQENS